MSGFGREKTFSVLGVQIACLLAARHPRTLAALAPAAVSGCIAIGADVEDVGHVLREIVEAHGIDNASFTKDFLQAWDAEAAGLPFHHATGLN